MGVLCRTPEEKSSDLWSFSQPHSPLCCQGKSAPILLLLLLLLRLRLCCPFASYGVPTAVGEQPSLCCALSILFLCAISAAGWLLLCSPWGTQGSVVGQSARTKTKNHRACVCAWDNAQQQPHNKHLPSLPIVCTVRPLLREARRVGAGPRHLKLVYTAALPNICRIYT